MKVWHEVTIGHSGFRGGYVQATYRERRMTDPDAHTGFVQLRIMQEKAFIELLLTAYEAMELIELVQNAAAESKVRAAGVKHGGWPTRDNGE